MTQIERKVSKDSGVHVILDDDATHKPPKERPGCTGIPASTSTSRPRRPPGLNQVERSFSGLTTRRLRRLAVTAVRELEQEIREHGAQRDTDPMPFACRRRPVVCPPVPDAAGRVPGTRVDCRLRPASAAGAPFPQRPAPMEELFSGAHPHLLVNHIPILGSFFALLLLLASYRWAGDALRRTAFVVLVGTALAAAASDLSGDAAEDAIEHLPGVSRDLIHEHEEAAEQAYIAAGVAGVLALAGLVRFRRTPVPRGATTVALGGTVLVSALMGYTGLLGGRVRHTEVRPGATAGALRIERPDERRE